MAQLAVRRNVSSLTDWDPILLWYAKAIARMQTRPFNDPTSWRYQAAIHDYIADEDPLAAPGDALPAKADQKRFWRQCQHGSWFFLPWHRMYLFYFEQIVKAAIAELKGDSASWSLPYWNYSDLKNPKARSLPPAFIAAKLPDGSPNPLRVADRQEGNDGKAVGDENDVDISACLIDPAFAAGPPGGNPGFGGPQTKFEHSGHRTGKLELTPHGNMHVAVGGWMGSFNTAALDPIFWLHHANIDRLWNVWLRRDSQHASPSVPAWLTAVKFEFHDPSGKIVSLTPEKVDDSTAAPLSYQYDDQSDPLAGVAPHVSRAMVAEEHPIPEMVGATSAPVVLSGKPVHAQFSVRQPTGPARKALTPGAAAPEIYLNFEDVTGSGKPERYRVYLNLPEGADPASHRELYAGDLSMFGVREFSRSDQAHSGAGMHFTLPIAKIVQVLESKGAWDPRTIRVTLIPKRPVEHEIRIGRISLYYA